MHQLLSKLAVSSFVYTQPLKCFLRTAHVTTEQRLLPQGLVYNSISDDVYYNLAFEDWIFHNADLSSTNILFFWRNQPCVVIGRHQNPWAECNLAYLQRSNFKVARRRSGGGTVFHDSGNLNCTFFTSRQYHDRKANLKLIVAAVRKTWPELDLEVSDRDDIMLNKSFKISGTAAKLTNRICYHHCTLLHSANVTHLKEALNVNRTGLTNKATPSVPSLVRNLSDAAPEVNHESLMSSISNEFYCHFSPYAEIKNYDVDPRDGKTWSGIHDYRQELQTWDWIFGKTPYFSIMKESHGISTLMHIRKGRIDGVVLMNITDLTLIEMMQQLASRLKGIPFRVEDIKKELDSFMAEANVETHLEDKVGQIFDLLQEAVT